ncbi:MAG TPA: hypothetical protein VHD69_01490 [Candidatus Paceibacterota bacterium]|nr:hypothetical protein [Candidatus Paceibacterota bacterium]
MTFTHVLVGIGASVYFITLLAFVIGAGLHTIKSDEKHPASLLVVIAGVLAAALLGAVAMQVSLKIFSDFGWFGELAATPALFAAFWKLSLRIYEKTDVLASHKSQYVALCDKLRRHRPHGIA